MSKLKPLKLLLATFLLSLTLAGCQTTRTSEIEAIAIADGQNPAAICRIWPQINPSRLDTALTIRQVTGANAARRGFGCSPEEKTQ